MDGLFVFVAVHILEGDFGPVCGDFVVVEVEEFFFGKEDHGLFEDFEFGLEATDGVLLAEPFADCPAKEPFEVSELFWHCFLVKVLCAS